MAKTDRRVPYLLGVLAILCIEYGVGLYIVGMPDSAARAVMLGVRSPLGLALGVAGLSTAATLYWLATLLLTAAALTVLALRRALDARVPPLIAALAMIPYLRLPVALLLGVLRAANQGDVKQVPAPHEADARYTVLACCIEALLAMFAVLVGAFVIRAYTTTLFVATPLLVGFIVGFLGNRGGDVGVMRTCGIVLMTGLLVLVGLVAFALEGIVCLAMAMALLLPPAMLGAAVGRVAAIASRRASANLFAVFVALPLLFAADRLHEERAEFTVESSVDIAATPSEVCEAVAHMRTIAETPPLPFRLGVAYPLRGEMFGEGVGATRHGVL